MTIPADAPPPDTIEITKETAVRRPYFSQGLRSAWPYLTFPAKPTRGRVVDGRVGDLRYWAYIPDVEAQRPLPVVYHLHGAGMLWRWVRKDVLWIASQQERAVEAGGQPMIVIAPFDETGASMWADAADGSVRMAHAVTEVLPAHVRGTYNALEDREHTHIQGFSMGGFGAATLGLKHGDRYGTITVFDGAMHNCETLTAGRSSIAHKQFADDPTRFEAWSPWTWAERAELSRTPILIAEGLMTDYNRRYRDHLQALGADLTYVITPCLHDLRGLQTEVGQHVHSFQSRGGR